MTEQEDTRKKSRRDLLLVLLILPFGVLCMFMAGQVAIKLAPSWVMNADMRSLLDPNAGFAAGGNPFLIEPLNSGILTLPAWGDLFLTPNAAIPTRLISLATPRPTSTPPPPPPPATPVIKPEATATVPGPIIIVPTHEGPLRSDLQIEISDNSRTYTPGTPINYTVLVTNLGPDEAPRFNVIVEIPGAITGLSVNCTPAYLCGTNTSSGNRISYTGATLSSVGVNQITISISGNVTPGATGNLVTTARIVIPSGTGVRDPNPDNNNVTDTDTQLSVYDLAITKSDGVGVNTYTAANPINYTIVVTNSGPSDALGINITDNRPAQISSWTWTCTTVTSASGCDGVTNSTSTFNDTVNIQSGGRIEYTVRATPTRTPQNLSNTASLIIPSGPGFIDSNPANNSATDIDIPLIDLQITKDDGVLTYTPGSSVTYRVAVTNNSTFNLTGVTVSDPKPTQITNWVWCVTTPCPAPISTDFTSVINLTAGSSLIYTVTANISGTAGPENLVNTASVRLPAGLVDAVPGNDSATDSDAINATGDLLISKDDGVTMYTPGGTLIYTVIVTNNSTISLNGVTVRDTRPPLISAWTWTCTPGPGASCTPGPSSGDINDTTVNLPAGGSVTYTINATVDGAATGALSNIATVSPPTGFTDTNPGNDSATDTDTLNIADPTPPEIGTTPDNNYFTLTTGADLILDIPTTVNGHAGPDLVYYEFVNAGVVYLDWIEVQVGDGTSWYTVFYWGDVSENADTNSNMNYNTLLPPTLSPLPPPEEYDQRHIQSADLTLFPPSGIAIDLDGYANPGIYPYVRFIAPAGDSDGHLEIDAVLTLP